MIIQKTFHLHCAQEAARARLANPAGYRWRLKGVEKAEIFPGGKAHFVFRLPWGIRLEVVLAPLPGETPSQKLFRSIQGNIQVLGALEYFTIRPDLTEVVLTLDYTVLSILCRYIDAICHTIESFLNHQLAQLETHFSQPLEGIRADTHLPEPINHHPHAEET